MCDTEKNVEMLVRERLASESVIVIALTVRLTSGGIKVAAVLDTEAGITVGECARYNRSLRELLEAQFPDISVEVASPGLDRALKTEQDFRRLINKQVRLIRLSGEGRSTEITGIVRMVAAGTVCILTGQNQEVAIPLDDIIAAKQEIRWSYGK
jgi:ribosome maturation factor RimP